MLRWTPQTPTCVTVVSDVLGRSIWNVGGGGKASLMGGGSSAEGRGNGLLSRWLLCAWWVVFLLGEWQTRSFGNVVARASMRLHRQCRELVVWSLQKRCHRGQFSRTWCLTKLAREGVGKNPDWHGWCARFWLHTWNQKDFFCSSSRKFSSAAPSWWTPGDSDLMAELSLCLMPRIFLRRSWIGASDTLVSFGQLALMQWHHQMEMM